MFIGDGHERFASQNSSWTLAASEFANCGPGKVAFWGQSTPQLLGLNGCQALNTSFLLHFHSIPDSKWMVGNKTVGLMATSNLNLIADRKTQKCVPRPPVTWACWWCWTGSKLPVWFRYFVLGLSSGLLKPQTELEFSGLYPSLMFISAQLLQSLCINDKKTICSVQTIMESSNCRYRYRGCGGNRSSKRLCTCFKNRLGDKAQWLEQGKKGKYFWWSGVHNFAFQRQSVLLFLCHSIP